MFLYSLRSTPSTSKVCKDNDEYSRSAFLTNLGDSCLVRFYSVWGRHISTLLIVMFFSHISDNDEFQSFAAWKAINNKQYIFEKTTAFFDNSDTIFYQVSLCWLETLSMPLGVSEHPGTCTEDCYWACSVLQCSSSTPHHSAESSTAFHEISTPSTLQFLRCSSGSSSVSMTS